MTDLQIPAVQVEITSKLLRNRIDTVAQISLMGQWQQIKSTGRLSNFLMASHQMEGVHEGYCFNDSDVYKWLEACAYASKMGLEPNLELAIDEAIKAIESAQEPNGYINTFFQTKHPNLKWRNLMSMHEMYCIGHLIEAGVAWYEQSSHSNRKLFDIALKAAEHVASIFGPERKLGYPGHEELEYALFRLADATDDPRWSELAGWMVESRGSRPSPFQAELQDKEALQLSPYSKKMLCDGDEYLGEYLQDHLPIRRQQDVVGHAVRAMYFFTACAKWAAQIEDASLTKSLERLWNGLINRRMYITGGIGPSGDNEGFTHDYDLPNMSAYAETCAGCALFWWGHQMAKLTDEAEYLFVMEQVLMNNVLAGISVDGLKYFYDNPLESRGQHNRVEWFGCSCCPPNVARLLLSLEQYVARLTEGGISIDFLFDSIISAKIKGVQVQIEVKSNYPWSDEVILEVTPSKPVHFELRVRSMFESEPIERSFPSKFEFTEDESGFLRISGRWGEPTTVTLKFRLRPTWIKANPKVLENAGKMALMYGPVVYCCENQDIVPEPDLNNATLVPQNLEFDPSEPLEPVTSDEPFPVISFCALGATDASPEAGDPDADELYLPVTNESPSWSTATFKPYFMWNNQGSSHMQVWVRRRHVEYDDSLSLN